MFSFFRCTLFTYYSVWQAIMTDADVLDFKRLLLYPHWCFAWYSFLDHLDISYEEGFCCAKDNFVAKITVWKLSFVMLQHYLSGKSFLLQWSLVIHHWVHPLNHEKQEDKLLFMLLNFFSYFMHHLSYYFGSQYDSRSSILECEHDIIY